MNPVFALEHVDADGAIREAEEAVAGDTRSAFFRKAAIGGGAVLSSGAIMGMLPELAAAAKPSKKQDLAILKFALTLEYLEAAFYAEAVSSGALTDANVKALANIIAGHEKTHVTTLRKVIKSLGSKVPSSPVFDFQGTTKDQGKFIATAYVLENTGVHAYLGQAGNLKSKTLLGAAASIVTVEARHASAVAILQGKSPFTNGNGSITPDGSFDRGFSKTRILKAVTGTNFIK
jgi:rubrerythrin